MKKLGIIKGFSVDIDISKIGYEWIAVQIYLKDYTQRDTILAYVKQNPFFVAQDVSIGLAHLELEFHISTINQLYQIMDDIMQHFPDAIRMYSYFKPFHVHKLQLFPEVC
jgi:hypothetical protein